MTVTFDGHTYTTDENGTISLSKADFTSGEHSVQVEKKNSNGAPAVLRYADDFTVNIARENTINVNLRIEGPRLATLKTHLKLQRTAMSVSLSHMQTKFLIISK